MAGLNVEEGHSRRRLLAWAASLMLAASGDAAFAAAEQAPRKDAGQDVRQTPGQDGSVGGNQNLSDVGAFLESVYAPYRTKRNWQGISFTPGMRGRYFSTELTRIWSAMEREFEKAGDVGPIDFDPVTGAQDEMPLDRVRIGKIDLQTSGDSTAAGARASATVSFREGGRAMSLQYELLREGKGWRIDNIIHPGGQSWNLRTMLGEAYRTQFGRDFKSGG